MLTLESIDIIRPQVYAEGGYPHEAFKLLREKAPVYWWDRDATPPFWAITKYEDIVWISKQPKRFLNAPRMAVMPLRGEGDPPRGPSIRHLLNMDPPEHGKYRKVTSPWFLPGAIQQMAPKIQRITKEIFDTLYAESPEGEIDFVGRVTAPLTLWVLADLLGVPHEDRDLMFHWTNQIASANDPEFRDEGETPLETVRHAYESLGAYFGNLTEQRRANPREDIVSVIANAKIDGKSIPQVETLSYYLMLVIGGNETTRNAASGGLLELIHNPAEFQKLRENPDLIDTAVEEIVRWTSPVVQFCRTPHEDFELRGQKIHAGENMCLFYPSGNRDADIFEDPDTFKIDRSPNRHIGYGIGEHFCLGASLARLELQMLFREIVARVEHVELAGTVDRAASSLFGGVKRMPLRYKLRP